MKKKPPKPPKHWMKPRPTMNLRRQTQREIIARLLLMGWTAEKVARKMKVTPRAIRYAISTPEFEALYAKLQGEYLQRVDRQMGPCWAPPAACSCGATACTAGTCGSRCRRRRGPSDGGC